MPLKYQLCVCLASLVWLASPAMAAKVRYGAGIDLHASTWSGNSGGKDDFSASRGQLGLQVQAHLNRWIGGLALLAGSYNFADVKPNTDQPSAKATRYDRVEWDFIVGYQVWRYVALYGDLKAMGYAWHDNGDNKVNYTGLGLGAQWHYPLGTRWTVYGNVVVASGSAAMTGVDDALAKANGFVIGGAYRFDHRLSLLAGIKQQGMKFNFDQSQEHQVGALVLGVHFLF